MTTEPIGSGQNRVISRDRASQIAREVQRLVGEGRELHAWELIRRLHPADAGTILVALPRTSRNAFVRALPPRTLTSILRQMNPIEAGRLSARLGTRFLSRTLSEVRPRDAMDTLKRLPIHRAREVAENLEQPLPTPELLEFSHGTSGALMVVMYPTVDLDAQVSSALHNLRSLEAARYEFTRVYVLGDGGSLAGHINMVDLALAQEGTPVRNILLPTEVMVGTDTPSEECARLRRHYNLTELPVVQDGKLVGVIPAEFLLSAQVENDTRQMLQVASVAGEAADAALTDSIRTRLPWLTLNLGTTFLAAAMIALFESTLAKLVVLAAFLPVVAGQGGIGGTQTLTLIVRAMALGQLVGINAWRLLTREAVLGLVHGIWLGVLVAGIAIVWQGNAGLAAVLGLAMLGNMVIAGTMGAAVPLFLRRVGIDPAVASAIVVTTFTDVFGFLLYLGIASAMISLII